MVWYKQTVMRLSHCISFHIYCKIVFVASYTIQLIYIVIRCHSLMTSAQKGESIKMILKFDTRLQLLLCNFIPENKYIKLNAKQFLSHLWFVFTIRNVIYPNPGIFLLVSMCFCLSIFSSVSSLVVDIDTFFQVSILFDTSFWYQIHVLILYDTWPPYPF